MIAGDKVTIDLPLYVEVDFEVGDDGVLRTVVVLDTGDDSQTPNEVYVDFEETVDSIMEFYSGEDHGFYNLYVLSNELRRIADKIHDQASLIDGSGYADKDDMAV